MTLCSSFHCDVLVEGIRLHEHAVHGSHSLALVTIPCHVRSVQFMFIQNLPPGRSNMLHVQPHCVQFSSVHATVVMDLTVNSFKFVLLVWHRMAANTYCQARPVMTMTPLVTTKWGRVPSVHGTHYPISARLVQVRAYAMPSSPCPRSCY